MNPCYINVHAYYFVYSIVSVYCFVLPLLHKRWRKEKSHGVSYMSFWRRILLNN
jgi:hypothetical protein